MMLFSCANNSMDDESMLMRKLGCLAGSGRLAKKSKRTLKMGQQCDIPEAPPPGVPPVAVSRKSSVRSEHTSATGHGQLVVVKQDFTASVVDEISVNQGEILSLLYVDNEWAYVTTSSSKHLDGGFIPFSYCQSMTEKEIERTRKRVVQFDDQPDSPKAAPRPQPAPRTSIHRQQQQQQQQQPAQSPLPEPRKLPSAGHSYHTLEAVALPRELSNDGSNMSQSMILIPQKFHQLNFAAVPMEVNGGLYASATMKQDFPTKKHHMYENHEANASLPNLANMPSGNFPRKMARPRGATGVSLYDSNNYIIPSPVPAVAQRTQENGRPRILRCDDLMSIDSSSLASLTGSTHSDGGTSLVVNLPGTYASSTALQSFKARVLFNFNADGQASNEHMTAVIGDVLDVVGQDGNDWYWVQTQDGRQGLIPACFLQPIHPEASTHCPATSSNSVPTQQTGSPPTRSQRASIITSAPSTFELKVSSSAEGVRPPFSAAEPATRPRARAPPPTASMDARGLDRVPSAERRSDLYTPPKPANSDLSRWLNKHSPNMPADTQHQLSSQNSVAYSIVSTFSNDSGEYSKLSAVRSNEKVQQPSSPAQSHYSNHQPAVQSAQCHYDNQQPMVSSPSPPSAQPNAVAQLAATLGNLVVVSPQPQRNPVPTEQQQRLDPPLKQPKPQMSSPRPTVAPKPKPQLDQVISEDKPKLYSTGSYSSLPETFRCSSTSPDYPEEDIYSSAEDISGLVYEDLEDEEAIARLEVICDFVANGDSQVSVITGDIVLANVEKSTRGWLWVGLERTGVQGFVPLSYTQPYETWAT